MINAPLLIPHSSWLLPSCPRSIQIQAHRPLNNVVETLHCPVLSVEGTLVSCISLSTGSSHPNKAQIEVRTYLSIQVYFHQTELATHRCSRVFPCASCVKKGCAAICPKGKHECTMCILVSCSRANSGSLTTGKGNRCAFFSLLRCENFQSNTSTIALPVSFSRTPKCFMTRSVSCLAASGSLRMRWQTHMPCTTAKGTHFCRMIYCKLNVPLNGNRGMRYHLYRKPIRRRPSTLWDLCECEGQLLSSLSYSPHPSRSISDTGRTNFYGQTANSYVGFFL